MPSYPGRYDFGVMRQNFGGIRDQASLLTVPNGAAMDVLNFDVNVGGEITRRGGLSSVYDFGSPVVFFKKYLYQGTEVFFAITSNGKFWSATNPAGAWADVTGSVTWSDYTTNPIIGAVLASKLILCNGIDPPLIYVHGSSMRTLKNASLQTSSSSSVSRTYSGAGATEARAYAVIGFTPRGECPPAWNGTNQTQTWDGTYWRLSANPGSGLDKTILDAAHFNIISWANSSEFTYFKIVCAPFFFDAPSGQYLIAASGIRYVATLGSGATTYSDTSTDVSTPYTTITVSTAYNTPADWETNGYPEGMAYVGKNRDERLFAWRKNAIWASSLSEPTNWYREDDAFAFTVIGSDDTNIKGIAGLFDYSMIMSKTACFLYTGASPTTIALSKVIPVGCASHNSITYAGQDAWWWSNYGPTNGSRIIQGADVALNTSLTNQIQSLIFQGTNTSRWDKIAGATDIVNNRIYWGVPKAAATTNNQSVVLNFEVSGFVRYDGFDWVGSAVYNNDVYIAGSAGIIYKMNTGNTDNGTPITASYTTGHMDLGSYPMVKRMLWVDVLADRRGGDYSFDFQYSADMGQQVSTAQTCTQTTTNGDTITTTSSTATEHRLYCEGIANTFQLIFTTSATTPLKLVAWRPEIRARGVRQ